MSDEPRHPVILVAEDEPTILLAVREFLESRGYGVRTASNGIAALAEVREKTPDLVVLDVSMPRLSGLDVALNLRFVQSRSDLPILVITGRNDIATRRRSQQAGADRIILKPFDLATLEGEVRGLLARKRPSWLALEDRYVPGGEEAVVALPEEVHRRLTRMTRTHRSMLGLLARSLDERGLHGSYHSLQVSRLAGMTATALQLDEEQLQLMRTAGLLHDLGLAMLPDAVLAKPGPLTQEEWRRIAQHPVLGARMLDAPPYRGEIASAVLHHHERWDGSGYPDGLEATAIPLGARILAVVDAFSAMTTRRGYADAATPEQAVAELERYAGTQFDPEVVDAFRRAAHL
ncbi:MAG: response regulator [Acidobacteria bacterium]|jgi:putative two-component system response regulator|nr:response regulator [Acidobacteriota bacterium]